MKIPFVSNRCANWTCSEWFYNTPLSYGNLPGGTAERASTYFAWAPGVNYVIGNTRWETDCTFLCFAAHLSAAGNRPIYGASHTDFWRPSAAIGWPIPCDGTFSHLLMKPAGGALGAGNTIVGMLTKNWIDTALTFTLGAADLSASDLVHSVAVSAGDYVQLSLRGVGTGALFSPNYAVLFEPTIPGLQPFMGYNYYETRKVCNGSLEGSYYYNGGELAAQCVVPFSGKFKYMWMDWNGPGMAAGSTATQTLRVNGVDSALALTFTGGESRLVSKKSDLVTEVAVNAGDMVSFRTTGTGVSGAFWIKHGICFIPDNPSVWFRVRSAGYQALTVGAIAYSPASLGTFFFGSIDWAAAEVPTIWPKSDVKITGVAARCTAPGVGAGRKFDVYHNHASAATVTVSGANVFNLSSGYDIQPNDFDTLCVSNERVGLPYSDRGSIAILGVLAPVVNKHFLMWKYRDINDIILTRDVIADVAPSLPSEVTTVVTVMQYNFGYRIPFVCLNPDGSVYGAYHYDVVDHDFDIAGTFYGVLERADASSRRSWGPVTIVVKPVSHTAIAAGAVSGAVLPTVTLAVLQPDTTSLVRRPRVIS